MVCSDTMVQQHAQNYATNSAKFDILGSTANVVRRISLPIVCTNVTYGYENLMKNG
jgi:hypothetical protein